MASIAFYGGTFDPVHSGHIMVSERITELFDIDRFYFLPAFHAPHKPDSAPTPALHRYTMLCLATERMPNAFVSTIEIDKGEKRYSFDTLTDILRENPGDDVYFVMGADSWSEIKIWSRWEDLLLLTNFIIVSRPGYSLSIEHVTDAIRSRIVNLAEASDTEILERVRARREQNATAIFMTSAVWRDVSATAIRSDIEEDSVLNNSDDVPAKVANYIEKYELYR
jgi:nicotinate-nucleotide adenylyltransferase